MSIRLQKIADLVLPCYSCGNPADIYLTFVPDENIVFHHTITLCEKCTCSLRSLLLEDSNTITSKETYMPTCPCGETDCIHDPAFIQIHTPEQYKELFGDLTLEEASAQECYLRFKELGYCNIYDTEYN